MKPSYRLGVNHHLLFPQSMADPALHEATLPEVLAYPEFAVVDLFLAGEAGQRVREAARVRDSGKTPVYNTPLLGAVPGCSPNAAAGTPAAERTRELARTHLDAAVLCGASVTNIASGTNPPAAEREAAWAGWLDFLEWFGREAADRRLRVVIEPFDQSIGKNLLVGPTADAAQSVREVQARGVQSVGLMVDMGHLPIMGETFAHGVGLSAPYLWHVHLGSAVMRDPSHPWYGDCHPPIGIPEGEHGVSHLVAFLKELAAVGYLAAPGNTLTFEMRPYAGTTERASVERWLGMLEEAEKELA